MKRQLHSEAERRRLMFERQQMDDAQRDAFITVDSVASASFASLISSLSYADFRAQLCAIHRASLAVSHVQGGVCEHGRGEAKAPHRMQYSR